MSLVAGETASSNRAQHRGSRDSSFLQGLTRVSAVRVPFLSCATKALQATRADPQLAERRRRADRAFDLLEKACPKLFSPGGVYTDHLNPTLRRALHEYRRIPVGIERDCRVSGMAVR